MAKKNEKKVQEMEMELFEAPEIKEEATVNVNPVVENPESVQVEDSMEMEMELVMDEETTAEMEELVEENVKKADQKHQEQKRKRGPKPGSENKKKDEKEKEDKPKKEKALNLQDMNIVQREIKKGRLSAPQGRIEKMEDGSGYLMKFAEGVIFPQDAKENMKEVEKVAKMNDGKFLLTNHASTVLNTEKFKAKHENGEEVEHDYVRVELHKPGREKDVIELFTVREAKSYLRKNEEISKKKEAEAKKKAEKAAKEKEEKEKEDKKEEATA
jgi:colicin import membrane protein